MKKEINTIEKDNKILNGQFFTITSPFNHDLFFRWYELIENVESEIFIEPFAGSNNIIKMIEELNLPQPKGWKAYDIDPPSYNVVPEFNVFKRDTIEDFPKGHKVGITNPPYLAKNSATRRNMPFPDTELDDLYKLSLQVMLEHLEYVAAIIPESFITQDKLMGRLYGVISLNEKMFEDTSVPVCLALFTPDLLVDFEVYRGDLKLGMYKDLKKELNLFKLNTDTIKKKWKFNDINGEIGLRAIDSTSGPSIEFIKVDNVDKSKIKHSSRSLTVISGIKFNNELELESFLNTCNKLLNSYRDKTQDVFMTSFKGLRDDMKYRRRLSFAEARILLDKAYEFWKEENE